MTSSSDQSRLKPDLEFALALADAADSITIPRFNALDLEVQSKADMTLVSDADKAAEQAVRTLIEQQRPGDSILGEEGGQQGGRDGRLWVIDPIDGTHNYVRGVPAWATLIALLEDGEPVIGVVSAPALGRRWWARKGGGAFTLVQSESTNPLQEASNWAAGGAVAKDAGDTETVHGRGGRPIHVSEIAGLSSAFFSFSSLSGWLQAGRGSQVLRLMDACWRTRGFGDFWSYMMVAEGSVDIAAEPELALHDMAALVPIVTEAGGVFTSLDGVSGPVGPGALVTNGLLHREVLDLLAPEQL